MTRLAFKSLKLTEKDLDFLVETSSPGVFDKPKLKQILREDEKLRNSFIEDEKVFRRVMDQEETFLHISPALYFEILLRKVARDLKEANYTLEKTGTAKIPVFDTKDIVESLEKESLLDYLADMLSSFIHIKTHTFFIKVGEYVFENLAILISSV